MYERDSLPNTIQVTLLSNNYTAYLVDTLEIKNLVMQSLDHLEGLTRCDRVDEDVAVDSNSVLVIE